MTTYREGGWRPGDPVRDARGRVYYRLVPHQSAGDNTVVWRDAEDGQPRVEEVPVRPLILLVPEGAIVVKDNPPGPDTTGPRPGRPSRIFKQGVDMNTLAAVRIVRDDIWSHQTAIRDHVAGEGPLISGPDLSTDDTYRGLAAEVSGEVWAAVSGARRRWLRAVEQQHPVDSDLQGLFEHLETTRRLLAELDPEMPFHEHP